MRIKIRGFTLIELMVTIAIIAIVVSFTFPRLSKQIAQYKFNHESRNIISLIRETRAQAIVLKADTKLIFSKSSIDTDTSTQFFWSAKNAQITSPTSIEFDMLGRIKTRPLNGCLAITDKNDVSLKKTIKISVLGGIDAIEENSSC